MRNEYVVAILHTAINIATANNFRMRPECKIIGNENSGRVDYAIRVSGYFFLAFSFWARLTGRCSYNTFISGNYDLICITGYKIEEKIIEGFAQNIVQLESSYETNKRKRKRGDEYFDYLVSTGRDWHFLLYLPGEIYRGSKLPFTIEFTMKLWRRSLRIVRFCVKAWKKF